MAEHHPLLRPLLTPSTTSSATSPPLDDHVLNNHNLISSNSGIIFRLCMVALIGTTSIWANHEASKGYAITILNEYPNTFAGKRFQLFYVSNDEATRIIFKASNTIENFLYRDSNNSAKKPIKSVTVKLVGHNLTDHVVVESDFCPNKFVLNISPSVMYDANFNRDLILAIRRGVARFWLWDGQGNAPKNLINGIVEYLVNILDDKSILSTHDSTTVCWDYDDHKIVAEFLSLSESRRPGFIGSLNEAMKDGWSDEKFHKLCPISEWLRYNSSSV